MPVPDSPGSVVEAVALGLRAVLGRVGSKKRWPVIFGYSSTLVRLMRASVVLATAVPIAFAADTVRITVMEIFDDAIMVAIPGTMEAGLDNFRFWGSLMSRCSSPEPSPSR